MLPHVDSDLSQHGDSGDDHAARRRSYELIADAFGLRAPTAQAA